MNILTDTCDIGHHSLSMLKEQTTKIENINHENKKIINECSYAEYILKSMSSFFNRMMFKYWNTNTTLESKDLMTPKINESNRSNESHESYGSQGLKGIIAINTLINKELTHQNKLLNTISNETRSNPIQKLTRQMT